MSAHPAPAIDDPKHLPVLWHFPISHFNEKVRWTLDWKGIPHLRQALAIGYVPRAWWATGQARLPILFLDGAAIADSTRIIEALERRYPEPPLYPRDAGDRRRALALEDFFDEEVGSPVRTVILAPLFERDPAAAVGALSVGMGAGARRMMRAIFPGFRAFYRMRHGMNDAAVAAAPGIVRAAFDRVAAEVGPSGYLAGDRFSVADLTAAALLAPIVVPAEHPHRPPEPLPPSFREFRASLAAHPGFRWVAEMYRRHRGTSAEVRGGR
jgi:glutathione S-transferase